MLEINLAPSLVLSNINLSRFIKADPKPQVLKTKNIVAFDDINLQAGSGPYS